MKKERIIQGPENSLKGSNLSKNSRQGFFKEIFDETTAALAIVDSNGMITLVNNSFCALMGYEKDELIGTNWTKTLPVDEAERLLNNSHKRQQNPLSVPDKYEIRYYKKDGELRYGMLSVAIIEHSKKSIASLVDITERKRAEEIVRISKEQYKSMVEFANDIVYSVDVNGNFTYVSPNWKDKLGHSIEEIIGMPFAPLVHPEDLPRLMEIVQQNFERGIKTTGIEYRVKHKDGSWKWHSSSTSPILNKRGEVISSIGIAHDISKRKEIEEALEESIFFFMESQRAAFIGSYKADLSTGTWESSEIMDLIFGIDENYEKTVNGWIDIIHPKDQAYMRNHLEEEVLKQKRPFNAEYRIVRKTDGKTRWVHGLGKTILDDNNNVKILIGTIQDITERKLTEQIISEHQTKLDIALKIAHLGPWEYDVAEELFHFNDTFFAIFGTNTVEIGSHSMSPFEYAKRFVHPDDIEVVKKEIKKALETSDPKYTRQLEHRMIYANGEQGYLTVRFSIVKDSNGKTIKLYGINQDITAIKKAEDELRKRAVRLRELNVMKDKFFSIIAHDLKSPFNSILGLSEILHEKTKEGNFSRVGEFTARILESSKKAMELLTNLIEWSQSATGRIKYMPAKLELKGLVGELTGLFEEIAAQKKISISAQVPENICVFADLAMISTVFRNLISNAIKFTPLGGNIGIGVQENDDEVLVQISDNGIGIPQNAVDKLFRMDESYSTSGTNDEKGTGLGLILCKEFIDKHGKKIGVDSTPGEGSTFYFTLKTCLAN